MSDKRIDEEFINNAGKVLLVQKHQKTDVNNQLSQINISLEHLSELNSNNLENLDVILMEAELLCQQQNIEPLAFTMEDFEFGFELTALSAKEKSSIQVDQLEMLETVAVDDNCEWEEYLNNIEVYAEKNDIDLSRDPFENLMTGSERTQLSERIQSDYMMKKAACDKYDYMIAAFCGAGAGLIDSFFVGMPDASKLGTWSDKQTDGLVQKFSKMVWNADKKNGMPNLKKEPDGIASAIGYLERRFKVNYDARYASDLEMGENILNMNTKNHHLKSLGHQPDLIGLFFSILDQFTGKASFISDGQIIRFEPKGNGFELKGGNFLAKLFSGFCNWIGHIMSDVAGSSGTRGHENGGKGMGVGIPFFEMFQFCNFGSFNVEGEQKNLAELMAKVFEKGYDMRHGIAMAIPVAINELFIRLLWAIKSRFYHERTWQESLPFGSNPELRRMLLVGHGTLCLVDGADAAKRSGGVMLAFVLHLNMIAWSRFAFAGLKEVRTLYKENCLDMESMEKDLELEWNEIYGYMY
ncbi:hypothetical protein GH810_03895 [Acetobacterium paludosum]|uniref:Uncharacterized protein n=1 Tax=Acetobacterium paludosum TaxID=52693 RepID=A0A923HSC5_9FIRM|nr:hypothetical protein [Acetobacterium paludosum]MBC3887446.1 hypothetical protein [Acetobacterium paludosum]